MMLGLEEAGIDRRPRQAVEPHDLGQHQPTPPLRPCGKRSRTAASDLGARQGPGQQRIDEGPVFIRQLGERQPDLVGDRAPGGDRVGKDEFVEWIGVPERAHRDCGRPRLSPDAGHDHAVLTRQRRTRQRELAGECCHLVGADLVPRLAVLAVAVQRDRAAGWPERPHALLAVLDPELLVEQPPPDHDRLAGEFGIDLVGHARDGQAAVDADQAPLRLAREGAEPLPGAHLPDAIGRQVRQPVVDARMRLGSMVAAVVGGDEAREPAVRLRFGLGFMEMVERLVRVLHGAEWPLDLALGARRRPPPIRAGGHVRS